MTTRPSSRFKGSIVCAALVVLAAAFLAAVYPRLSHTYLEDDLLWLVPVVVKIVHAHPLPEILRLFHTYELTLFDGAYFSFLHALFGDRFWCYTAVSLVMHFANAGMLFILLSRGIGLSLPCAAAAGVIYFTFYGHFHVYLWPMAAHHLVVIFFIMAVLLGYLKTEQCRQENQPWGKTYALTLLLCLAGSVTRFSILIIPVILVGHIVLRSQTRRDLLERYRLWLPAIVLVSVYQVVLLGSREAGEVLEQLGRVIPGSGEIVFWLVVLSLGYWAAWGYARKPGPNAGARYIGKIPYVVFFLASPLLICLGSWLFAAPWSSVDTGRRWQMMALPAGYADIMAWVFLALGVYSFIRALKFNQELIVFVLWYLATLPYLFSFHGEIPLRYLAYAASFFAVIVSLFFMETLPRLFSRIPAGKIRVAAAICIGVLSLANLHAIYDRSVRTVLQDNVWGYDYIKAAHLIKADADTRKVSGISACVQGVRPAMHDWEHSFLGNLKLDGTIPFAHVFRSVAGETARLKVNVPCAAGDMVYDMDALLERPFLMSWLRGIAGPRWDESDMAKAVFTVYGRYYDPDPRILRIQRMIQKEADADQDPVFSSRLRAFYALPSGIRQEEYRGFQIVHMDDRFFTVRANDVFNLARFKRGDYALSFVTKTKHEARAAIDVVQGDAGRPQMALPGSLGGTAGFTGTLRWAVRILGVPVGEARLESHSNGPYDADAGFSLRPLMAKAGLFWRSQWRVSDFLPIVFQEKERRTVYHHDRLLMERRGYEEDIFADTRDPLTLTLWLMHADRTGGREACSTMNIGRDLYRVCTRPSGGRSEPDLRLSVTVTKLDKDGQPLWSIPLDAQMVKEQGWYRPMSIWGKWRVLGLTSLDNR